MAMKMKIGNIQDYIFENNVEFLKMIFWNVEYALEETQFLNRSVLSMSKELSRYVSMLH